jgi:uncharacterized YccA/Bax inhibitor family protein
MTSLLEARITVVARSSALPAFNFVIIFAVVGKTRIISAQRDKEIWSISFSLFVSNISSKTLLFDKDVKDKEVTNSLPLFVSIVFTSALFLVNNLTRSKAL